MKTYERYNHHEDLSVGVRDYNHPEIVKALETWGRIDTEDPIHWARYQRGARMK